MSELSRRLADAKGDRSIDAIVAQAERHGHSIGRATVARYVTGQLPQKVPDGVLQSMAAGLGLDVRELRVLAGKPAGELGPWTPTDESARLNARQRRALDQLIKTMVAGEEGESGGDTAATKKRGSRPGRPTRDLTVVADAEPDAVAAHDDPENPPGAEEDV